MAVHQFPDIDTQRRLERHYIYALFCQEHDGPGYVKIGMTRNPNNRLCALRSGCPVPAKMFAAVDVGRSITVTRDIEKALFEEFADKRIGKCREWFRFDFASKEDKDHFNRGSKRVLRAHIGPRHEWWTLVNIKKLDEYNEFRRRRFIQSRKGRRIMNRQKADQRFKRAMGIES